MRGARALFLAVAVLALGLIGAPARAGIQYYVDPVNGNDIETNGSQARGEIGLKI